MNDKESVWPKIVVLVIGLVVLSLVMLINLTTNRDSDKEPTVIKSTELSDSNGKYLGRLFILSDGTKCIVRNDSSGSLSCDWKQ
jgi:hypothetical protein